MVANGYNSTNINFNLFASKKKALLATALASKPFKNMYIGWISRDKDRDRE